MHDAFSEIKQTCVQVKKQNISLPPEFLFPLQLLIILPIDYYDFQTHRMVLLGLYKWNHIVYKSFASNFFHAILCL